ncbi:MAG: response regulator [Hyphomicrobiales bacterium]
MTNASSRAPLKILIVDDDIITRKLVGAALLGRGYRVTQVDGLTEAGKAIATSVYDVSIVDLNMPDGNGMEFVHLVRRGLQSLNPAMTIIVCSAYAAARPAALLQRLGADAVFEKPVPLELLAKLIETEIENRAA